MRLLTIFIMLLSFCYAQENNTNKKINNILSKTYNVLKDIDQITYKHTMELNYASEGYQNTYVWSCFYKFEPTKPSIDIKFQIRNKNGHHSFFNGNELFHLDDSNKEIKVINNPDINDFNGTYFLNSIITLRNILQLINIDTNVIYSLSDTTICDISYYKITLNIGKRLIQKLGYGFDQTQTRPDFIYNMLITKDSYMPYEIIQANNLNEDFIKTTFTDINLSPKDPEEISWYYTTYTNQYQIASDKPKPKLLPLGSSVPDFNLPLFGSNDSISFNSLEGKNILLYFWIKNCGHCLESILSLNQLHEKYNASNFDIISVNLNDSNEEIQKLVRLRNINYKILTNGDNLFEKFGVTVFPTYIIIGTNGKIIHSQVGFPGNLNEIENIIKPLLSEK